jgi:hypothetical protein
MLFPMLLEQELAPEVTLQLDPPFPVKSHV